MKCQWRKFLLFCELSNDFTLPICNERLCLYIQFLSRSLKAPQSIHNYVSGLKTLHCILDFPFPSLSSLDVKLTFKGLHKSLSHVPFQACPVTPQLLRDLSRVLDFTDKVDITFYCLCLFLFFIFARRSQFVPDSGSKKELFKLVRRSDVKLVNGLLYVMFRWTKTLQAGGRVVVIPLAPVRGSILCPVSAYFRMISLIPAPSSSPLFVFPPSLQPMSYKSFQSVFRSLVGRTGRDPTLYSSHSFRRGGASFAYSIGVPGELIQAQGDWVSDCYKRYLHLDLDQRKRVSESMAQALSL